MLPISGFRTILNRQATGEAEIAALRAPWALLRLLEHLRALDGPRAAQVVNPPVASRIHRFPVSVNSGVPARQERARLVPAEAHLANEPLALPDPQADGEPLGEVVAQELAIPEALGVPQGLGWPPQVAPQPTPQAGIEHARAPGPGGLLESAEPVRLEPADPVLHGSRAVAEQLGHLVASRPPADQEDPVKAVLVPRLLRPEDLLPHRDLHGLCIGDLEFAHSHPLSAA